MSTTNPAQAATDAIVTALQTAMDAALPDLDPGTILVRCKRNGTLYLSPDGTPRSATRWLIGREY